MTEETPATEPGQEPVSVQEPGTNDEPAQPTSAPDADPTDDTQPFDQERAMKLIRKQRAELKEAQRTAKELEQLRAEKKAADLAKLSEQERLTKQLAERDADLARERQAAQDLRNRYAVQTQAQKLGVIDPEAAVKLLDWATIELDSEGKPADIEQALKDLVAEKPYLVPAAQPQRQPSSTNPTNPPTRRGEAGSRVYTTAELTDPAIWNANRDDITLAYRQGRIRES